MNSTVAVPPGGGAQRPVAESLRLIHGDMLAVLPTLDAESIDAIVTDPPYGLGFMGQKWDTYANETGRAPSSKRHKFDHVGGNHNPSNSADAARTRRVEGQRFGEWCAVWVAECLRVLKPGGHMLAFGSTRTWHRLAVAVEDAGFEIRDTITWHYGSGFPKSLDVSKAIDKAAGAEREVVGPAPYTRGKAGQSYSETRRVSYDYDPQPLTAPATDAARQWSGWGTALKPASEPIVVARKPLTGTVAANVLAHGTGAINVDGCRVRSGEKLVRPSILRTDNEVLGKGLGAGVQDEPAGRWPTNAIFSHAPCCGPDEAPGECVDGCPVAELNAQGGFRRPGERPANRAGMGYHGGAEGTTATRIVLDEGGGASRFFPTFRYQAKAPTKERPKVDGKGHPTVKPLGLMRWLVRLVTPPGGTVLDPFCGTGPTLQAAQLEGFNAVGIELDEFNYRLACQRLGIDQQSAV